MVYVDTSAIVKLYIKEPFSKETAEWITANNQPVPVTIFHELEFTNALALKQFRREIATATIRMIRERFQTHEIRGVYFRPAIDWPEAFAKALSLAEHHTKTVGARSLDILHVASALLVGADYFLTFDQTQFRLAESAGLTMIDDITK